MTTAHDDAATQLSQISERIDQCQGCALAKTRHHTVPGSGNPQAEIMLIGEGPGRQEDQQGQPFVGASGKYLDKLLQSAGLSRNDVFLTNIVKCRPPENSNPGSDHIKACRPWLQEQIAAIQPKLVVLLGGPALQWFFPEETSITKSRSRLRLHPDGFGALPTFHPAAGLRRQSHQPHIEQDFGTITTCLAILKADPEQPEPPPPPPDDTAVADADTGPPAPAEPQPLDAMLDRLLTQMTELCQPTPPGSADPRQARHRLHLLAQITKLLSGYVQKEPEHPHAGWRRHAVRQVTDLGQRLNQSVPQICKECRNPFYGPDATYRPQQHCPDCE